MKIEKLTPEQEANVAEYRDRYFAQATSTERADRPRAEAAARRLAEIGGVKVNSVVWALSAVEGQKACEAEWASLEDSLRASLWDGLVSSLWTSLGHSLEDSLGDSLRASLVGSLRYSLVSSLRASLWYSLRYSRGDSLRDSLRASLRDSLRYSGWACFYDFAQELGVEYDPKYAEILELHKEIGSSCFALWIVPGTVILCEQPSKCEVVDGRLVNIEW